jgi:hypothetical protein
VVLEEGDGFVELHSGSAPVVSAPSVVGSTFGLGEAVVRLGYLDIHWPCVLVGYRTNIAEVFFH